MPTPPVNEFHPMPTKRKLYSKPRRPFYIEAPSYRRTSAGIRVMHLLCHALNSVGEEAYVYPTETNPSLDTPIATPEIIERHRATGRQPIVVYPEVVSGNPRGAGSVVRYVLNRPGFLGGDTEFPDTELVFGFGRNALPEDADSRNVLFLPPIDISIFNNLDNPNDNKRAGVLLYPGRYVSALSLYPDVAARATLITPSWPESHEQLAELFRRSEAVYCFESTAIATEAILCGCPAIVLPSPFFNGALLNDAELGRHGFALNDSPEEVDYATRTVGLLWEAYEQAEERFWQQLEHFIALAQAMPFLELPPAPLADPEREGTRNRYATWHARTAFAEIDAQLLAERMVLKWTKRPGMHLLMALHPGEEGLLADTLDSLAIQLYPDWLLSVVTELPKPEGLDELPNLQWLSLQDASHIDYVIDEIAAASAGTWLARIEPGLTFEPHALQVFADYINARPMWHLMYCDEDTREEDGALSQPLFKPDLNLDLLRAQNYFGAFVLVEKEAFLVTGRYGTHRGAETYDLSLRVLDQVGPQAVGHVDQMLVHLPRASTRAMAPEAERLAVEDHLRRRGLAAEVGEGIVFGTRHIEYAWPETPLVSIVIQTRDREEYLRPLLDSLHEHTLYPNYELIIVDNETRDPDAAAWLTTIPSDPRWRGRAQVLPMPGPFNWAAGANLGAEAASGEYILFLDNDMHVVQDEWLSRLIGIAQRPEVGIVGPRLAFAETARVQETGWVLGLHGLAGSPWKNDMDLTDPGYMGRAVCDQRVGAVSGSALLVRMSLLAEVGGFDADAFPVFDGALDLCLRIAERGKDVVWTPYSMIVHYGGVSMHERQTDPASALSDLLARKAEREQVLGRWLPQLANDPSYNRHLSLVEPYKPEHVVPITWDTRFHDRPRIMGIPLSGAAGEYRLRAPLRTIARAGLAETLICEPPAPKTVRILSAVELARAAADVVIFHQPVDDLQAETLQNLARLLPGTRRIITIDDLITAVPKKNAFHKFGFKDARPRLRKTLGLADRLVVSTEPLADFCRDMIDDIRIMPNCLEKAIWDGARPPGLPRRKPRVGWAGAQQHLGDLELIYPVVEALADDVDWIFMGMCPDPLRPFVHEFHDFVRDFERYPAALAQLDLDLALAPLEINAFNEAKSNLRLLEYGFMGWPVVCTDVFPYQVAPVTRLANDPQRWIAAIREQLADPEGLHKAGKRLQDWVLSGFMIEDHAASWLDAYRP
jgi:GT2 family glycosyltransferase